VRRVVGTCGTNLKTIDVHNARQKIVVRGIKKKLAPISNLKMITIQRKKSWYVVLKKKLAPISNLKMFTRQRKKSWYVVLKKKLAPISNLKMFTIQRKISWYVVLKKKKLAPISNLKMFTIQRVHTRSDPRLTAASDDRMTTWAQMPCPAHALRRTSLYPLY